MRNLKPANPTSIKQAAQIIKAGGLVAFPTETVYGLGADATNPKAVAKIFEVKNRPYFDPLIVHVDSTEEAYSLWRECPPIASKLMEIFWPGPLTLVLPKTDRIPDLVTASLPTVAVRMPNHAIALDLIRESHCPIAAPSANQFNRPSPTTALAVHEELGTSVELILDQGPTQIGIESTVLAFEGGKPVLLRPGGVTLEDLQEVIKGDIKIPDSHTQESPGMLTRHYSPDTPLYHLIVSGTPYSAIPTTQKIGLLSFKPNSIPYHFEAIEILSPLGDLKEAAAHFFQLLRKLDSLKLDTIIATPFPNQGLGLALMDRLSKACSGEAIFHKNKFYLLRRP